ncbi:MAG: AAA family ATPase, partial [Ignavibacteriaceae bacterium]
MIIKHTGEFELAFQFIKETNKNIFLTGKAGTGKTTFLKYLRENSVKKSVVAAPTGVAAINAHGVTLHSLFQLPFGIILPEKSLFEDISSVKNHPLLSRIHYNKEKINLLRSIELLIIDEASMVASYTVDAIDTILRHIRRIPNQPFGGVQVLFIGDLYQLELKEIFRQKDDKFIEILNGIRNNNITEENFHLLNSKINRSFSPKDHEEYITLTTHNHQADDINKRKLSSIPERAYFFHSEVINDFPEHLFPAENELKLKTGSQVMFLKNDTEGKQYFNGKLGIVTELEEHRIKVKCKNDPDEIEVKRSEWQNINYKIEPETNEITEEVLGSFIQYPLRLAWAITIHKSQGLTFDRVIIDAAKA